MRTTPGSRLLDIKYLEPTLPFEQVDIGNCTDKNENLNSADNDSGDSDHLHVTVHCRHKLGKTALKFSKYNGVFHN